MHSSPTSEARWTHGGNTRFAKRASPPASSGARSFFVVDGDTPLDSKHQRINREITAPQVRLVGLEGEQLGIVAIGDALAQAEAAEVDLVEIAPMAEPPVVRIMDYGKFKYRESKRAHEAKVKLKQIQVKEVKFRPGTDDGDYKIKLRNLTRFLQEGDKAKITMRFRGREMAHQEFGVRLLERIRNDLEPYAQVEQFPRLEGRQMVMLLAPKKVQVQNVKPAPVQSSHPNKPEAGPANSAPQASPAQKPESTAVGSK